MKDILTAALAYVAIKLKLIPQEDIDDLVHTKEHRKEACSDCVLRSGNWCDKNKVVITHLEVKDRNDDPIKALTSGCGCYLPLKWYSREFENATEPLCPLSKW